MAEQLFLPSGQDIKARFETLSRLGQGAFGEVRLGLDKMTGQKVAMKVVRISSKAESLPKAIFRELEALKQLSSCPLIVRLLNVFPDETNLCIVLEYVSSDLSLLISTASSYLPRSHVKSLAHMLLEAVTYCHDHHIIHRDIKPSNVLLTESGRVKLADFGLARVYGGPYMQSLSHQVATRWYRAPELLFASRRYTPAVDVWAVGTVLAELWTLVPLFPGNNDIDQMFRVFQILGSPNPTTWPGVELLPDYSKVS